jgi:hypothetical protein
MEECTFRVSIVVNPGARLGVDDDVDLANFIYENTTRATLDLDLVACWMNDRELLLMLDWQSRSFLA